MDEGRFDDAKKIFGDLLERRPGNVAISSLYEGAAIALAQSQREVAVNLANLEPTGVSPAPFRAVTNRPAPVTQSSRPPRLVKVSDKRNQITDDEKWFQEHGLAMPQWQVPNAFRQIEGNLPPEAPTTFGRAKIVRAIRDEGHAILMYASDYSGGRLVLVLDGNGKVVGAFDFGSWSRSPKDDPADAQFIDQRITWAIVRDGVLFVSHGHNTYAKSSGGLNAFISAIDVRTGALLWRSAPLVANAGNFLYRDGWIITGYGFTAEPDFLFVLDAKTGKTKSKVKVKSGPDVILEKGGKIFVRTYDTDYVFDLV
jgi:hypothetical protein